MDIQTLGRLNRTTARDVDVVLESFLAAHASDPDPLDWARFEITLAKLASLTAPAKAEADKATEKE